MENDYEFLVPEVEITTIAAKRLLGIHNEMSFVNNLTLKLWQQFMSGPVKHLPRKNNELISMQVYPVGFFEQFNPSCTFTKWACIEALPGYSSNETISEFTIPSGLYAIFHYKGPAKSTIIFNYIFQQWLPSSGIIIDYRPFFEVLGEKYNNQTTDSEEDIYIPIKPINEQ